MNLIAIGKATAVAALAGTAVFTGVAAATPNAPAPTPTSTTAAACHPLLANAPDALRNDLTHLRSLPKDQRKDARHEIRAKIKDDAYGDQVKAAANKARAERQAFWKAAPDQLKTDIKAAHKLGAGQERRDAIKAIWQKALKGDYGDAVKQKAQQRQQHHQECKDQRSPAGSTATS